ncbi:MAG: (2Fe-2S)-binding protein [Polaromonas sp.]|nr:MAG: (2Fe-2S)-binding protein [Polaromonas sp.]
MDDIFTIRLEPVALAFKAPACLSLLESAEMSRIPGLELVSSCRNGTCRTCICRLISGSVAYRVEWPGLSFEEKREGYVLPCVAYPLSDVVIDVPV